MKIAGSIEWQNDRARALNPRSYLVQSSIPTFIYRIVRMNAHHARPSLLGYAAMSGGAGDVTPMVFYTKK